MLVMGARGQTGYVLGRSGGAAGNGLLTGLVAYWPLSEASGNAIDLHSGGLTLTAANAPGAAAGQVYATARTFVPASTQYFSRAVSADVQPADQMVIAAWIYPTSFASPRRPIVALQGSVDTPYILYLDVTGKPGFVLFAGGANYGQLIADAAISLNAWSYILAEFERPTLRLSVNGGATKSLSWNYSAVTGTGNFNLGRETVARYFDGRIGPVAFWKNRTLSAADRTALWNGGAGLAYSGFS